MAPEEAAAPGSRTPRSVAMQAMVDATVELLEERSPDDVTIRDIAGRCGHHHRFVAGWFGSKVGLFRVAFDRMAETVADGFVLEVPRGGTGPRPPIVRLLQLMNWLAIHDPEPRPDDRATPLIARVSQAYETQFGMSAELARLSAQRLTGYFLLTVLYPGPLGVRPADFQAHLELEARIVRALSTPEDEDPEA